ncbi:NADH dehydrogenase subunit 6 (mitochondrion) [Ylistrum balloti]|uniref:NADH dehydrogenase subunit 6 n=1 Tax=Ylistrum balloti TaxID=509963 RepID=UPI00226D2A70|nr:NADH dehydrogenase subunit 6 [Ylistrum balloti]UZN43419.1 NADH dehydrogenase subunit 6 [Ylistrum balloti]
MWILVMFFLVGCGSLVGPQAVGCFSFFSVLLGCLVFGYSGAVWLSHFIFLSFLGGLMVVFLYAVALAPNPLFKSIAQKTVRPMSVIMFIISVSCLIFYYDGWWCYKDVFCGGYVDVSGCFGPELSDSSWVGSVTFLFLAVLLAICMVSVTKLCWYNKSGALRGIRSTMK